MTNSVPTNPPKLRVVNLGLPKSGTTTLGEALKHAGLRVADWKIRPGQSETVRGFIGKLMYEGWFETGDPLQHLGQFDAFSEIDIVRDGKNLWPQTDWALLSAIRRLYPGVKFVLSYRNPEKHADSMRRWSNLGTRRLPQNAIPGLPEGYGYKPGELERWIEGHAEFCRQVFAGSTDFLEYNIEDPEANIRIESFLGIELPWWGRANSNEAHSSQESVN